MCLVFGVSRSRFYTWLDNGLSNTSIQNQVLTEEIRAIHDNSKQTYGSPRITRELIKLDVKVSCPRVARLMKKAKIRSIVKRKFRVTTDSEHRYPIVENKLNRQFKVGKIAAWVSDITYIKTTQGWLYLTIISDLADRKIIGWSLSSTLKAIDTVIPAWKMARKNRSITSELIFHSDRGIQYACSEFKSLLDKNPLVIRSMSRKGNCWDNAVAESFFKTLKAECVYQSKFINKHQAAIIIFEYIEIWYNRKRSHSALGYLFPKEFEDFLSQEKLAA
jgi:putative transposase